MKNLKDRLKEVEAELAAQDRQMASTMAVLQSHAAQNVSLELADDLLSELDEAFEVTNAERPQSAPVLGARC